MTNETIARNFSLIGAIKFIPDNLKSNESSNSLKTGQLIVKICSIENLGPDNLYCKTKLYPSLKSSSQHTKTSILYNVSNPVWNHSTIFNGMSIEQIKQSIVEISLYSVESSVSIKSKKLLGNIRLGSQLNFSNFSIDSFENDSWNEFIVELVEGKFSTLNQHWNHFKLDINHTRGCLKAEFKKPVKKHGHSRNSSQISNIQNISDIVNEDVISVASGISGLSSIVEDCSLITGSIQIGLSYNTSDLMFLIHIIKATDVVVDKKGHPHDVYAKILIKPEDKFFIKKKTSIIKKSTDPIWNEIISYKCRQDILYSKFLSISIWNNESFGHNYCLGEALISLKQIFIDKPIISSNELVEWYPLYHQVIL